MTFVGGEPVESPQWLVERESRLRPDFGLPGGVGIFRDRAALLASGNPLKPVVPGIWSVETPVAAAGGD